MSLQHTHSAHKSCSFQSSGIRTAARRAKMETTLAYAAPGCGGVVSEGGAWYVCPSEAVIAAGITRDTFSILRISEIGVPRSLACIVISVSLKGIIGFLPES